ncbi:solute carrier family 35 member F2-like [Nelusetta ayraudi]|uniref:solute carrier family 35 member F2-like n=1 Tax=Nelusetta ayraudi TaxID=303726 RepID=UPI003F703077
MGVVVVERQPRQKERSSMEIGECEEPTRTRTRTRTSGLLARTWRSSQNVCSWKLFQTLAMGQGLGLLICATAITSQYLATSFHVNAPMLQSLFNYALLCVTYTSMLLCRRGSGNIIEILRQRWWKYLLVGVVDVEANYTVVKAYQYTNLTSIQLLDCFVIPVLMILSRWFLKTRYRIVHYVAVCICLLGVGAMVGADLLTGREQGSSSNILLGDCLVLVSATLYAVSNVCQEYTVKNLSQVEFLGMVGLFGTIISCMQMALLEHREVAAIEWSWQVGLLFSGYALSMFALYSLMPLVVKRSSAASVNLSLLTADLFSIFAGVFLFHYSFSGLYIVSLVAILIGFIAFNAVPTPSVQSDASSSSCQESHTNPHLEPEEAAAGNAAAWTENDGKAGEQREKWGGRCRASRPQRRHEESKINWNAVIEHSTKL